MEYFVEYNQWLFLNNGFIKSYIQWIAPSFNYIIQCFLINVWKFVKSYLSNSRTYPSPWKETKAHYLPSCSPSPFPSSCLTIFQSLLTFIFYALYKQNHIYVSFCTWCPFAEHNAFKVHLHCKRCVLVAYLNQIGVEEWSGIHTRLVDSEPYSSRTSQQVFTGHFPWLHRPVRFL